MNGSKLRVDLTIVPPPHIVSKGGREERFTKDVDAATLGAEVSALLQQMINETGAMEIGACAVVTVQMSRSSGVPS